MIRWLITMAVLAGLLLPRGASADPYRGAFSTDFGFFVGGGVGGGLSGLKVPGESEQRFAVTVPLNLRAGFDMGRYGLAVMLDTHYSFSWGPAADQGPSPAKRDGRFEALTMLGSLLWRTPSPFYLTAGAGGALTSQGQNLLEDPAQARAVIMVGLGFIYRFERKGDNVRHYPFGMSISFESRFYVPWDERFLRYTVGAVLTFYFVFSSGY
ncbi:MAG: hypothetical protein ABI333_22560 [bacterium]